MYIRYMSHNDMQEKILIGEIIYKIVLKSDLVKDLLLNFRLHTSPNFRKITTHSDV